MLFFRMSGNITRYAVSTAAKREMCRYVLLYMKLTLLTGDPTYEQRVLDQS